MSKNDGGQAFPSVQDGYLGMTIRDYLAGQALKAMACRDVWSVSAAEVEADLAAIAKAAYRMADAMLKARGEE